MARKIPFAWIFGGLLFVILLAVFLVRKAAITGNAAAGEMLNAWSFMPASSGMIVLAAVAALILIVIFAGIGKIEH